MILIVCGGVPVSWKLAGMNPDPRPTLAANIRELRLKKGWSQERLAEESGLHRTYIGGVERSERNPSLGSITRIADALSVTVWELLKPGATS